MIDKILDELAGRLKIIEEKCRYLSFLIDERYTNEKLLQLEVMRIISLMSDVIEYLPEKPYNYSSKHKCDFWFKTADSTEHWMEIKMRPTNYGKAKHAKATTKAVDSIVSDIKRLKEQAPKEARKYVLFAFFPMYRESYSTFNKIHLPKISNVAGKEIISPSKSIQVGEASFDLYLIEL
jgi:hypothetical protein